MRYPQSGMAIGLHTHTLNLLCHTSLTQSHLKLTRFSEACYNHSILNRTDSSNTPHEVLEKNPRPRPGKTRPRTG